MKLPSKELAVTIPVELILAKVEAVLVMMLSVDATPVRPVPSPTKLDAVTTPTNSADQLQLLFHQHLMHQTQFQILQ